jgi:MmyB-like transcription regulator ligand binding domain
VYGVNRAAPGGSRDARRGQRLERGNLNGASESVLEALALALQLDEVEHAHLFDLARTATNARSRPPARWVRPAVQRILDAMTGAPAWVRNARMDFLAANWLGDGRSHRERRAALTCRQQPDRDQQVVPRRGTVSSIR